MDAPGATPFERGEAAIGRVLASAPYAAGTRERVSFVKGMADAALKALAACKPKVPNPIPQQQRAGR